MGALLLASAPYAAVDPRLGDGTALIEITRNTGAHPVGIEFSARRGSRSRREVELLLSTAASSKPPSAT